MGGKWSRQRSKVATDLPPDIRQQVHGLLIDGATYEEISEWLKSRGFEISKSAVGRHGKKFFEIYQRMAAHRDQVEVLTGEAGDALALDGVLSQMLMQQLMEKVMSAELDILQAPQIMGQLARLQRETTNREKLRADLTAKVADVIEVAEKGGLSGEAINEIRTVLMGAIE